MAAAGALALTAPAAEAFTKVPTATGKGGAAATADELATKAAINVLRRGGNAVDATVAAAGVLSVVEPFSCGLGGGGFMVIRRKNGRVTTIDSRETAPESMQPTSFYFANGEPPEEFEDARYTGLSAGVPGTPLAWARALNRFGTMRLRKLLRPGERVAREGFLVDKTYSDQVDENVPWFDDITSTSSVYLDADGTAPDVGSRVRNPDLAQTFRLLMRKGVRRGFYRGALAGTMAAAAQRPPVAPGADHNWVPGLMTAEDVRGYHAPFRKPTRVGYRGFDVWSMRPPSSGGTTVGEALNILEGFQDLGADHTEALHRYLEATRLAYADRAAYVADPSYTDVPRRGLLSDEFAAERRALIGETPADSPVDPGDPGSHSTTHLTVADRKGNVVSYTFTIESIGGNGIVVPGYGFLLNNELTDFTYDDATDINAPEAGKRPRSSMAPTIVTKNDKPKLALGSPGGSMIITTVLQTLMERIDFHRLLPAAILVPRASQRNRDVTDAELAFIDSPEGVALAARGHRFEAPDPPGEIGYVHGIEFRPGKRFIAAAEPTRRGGGSAGVVRPG